MYDEIPAFNRLLGQSGEQLGSWLDNFKETTFLDKIIDLIDGFQ
jgi:hypothetical protein